MYVYNLHRHCQRSILLYPAAPVNQDKGGRFQLPLADGTGHECHLGFVEVVGNQGLKRHVGEQVKEKLLLNDVK
jgi:hypothetical protein